MNTNLTISEIKSLINTKSDKEWNFAVEKITSCRGGKLPNDWRPMLRQNKVMAIASLNWANELIPVGTNIAGLRIIAQNIWTYKILTPHDHTDLVIKDMEAVLSSEEMKLDAVTLPELTYVILIALDKLGISNRLRSYPCKEMIKNILKIYGYLNTKCKDSNNDRYLYTLLLLDTFSTMDYPRKNSVIQDAVDKLFKDAEAMH